MCSMDLDRTTVSLLLNEFHLGRLTRSGVDRDRRASFFNPSQNLRVHPGACRHAPLRRRNQRQRFPGDGLQIAVDNSRVEPNKKFGKRGREALIKTWKPLDRRETNLLGLASTRPTAN